jgi:hypothetical protein
MFGGAVGICQCCGRSLTNPHSVQAGIGPICAARRTPSEEKTEMNEDDFMDRPLLDAPEGVYAFNRITSTCFTNVPHLVTHHSPTGFEWGYAGSGPADLALNILEDSLRRVGWSRSYADTVKCWAGVCSPAAWRLHQEFKRKFIEPMMSAGGEIKHETVDAWLAEHLRLEWRTDETPHYGTAD